jgi:glutathione peroxidase
VAVETDTSRTARSFTMRIGTIAVLTTILALMLGAGCSRNDSERPQPIAETQAQEKQVDTAAKPGSTAGPLDFTVTDIDGNEVALDRYRGKVVMIVNVASKCGLTPQYQALQTLHERYADRGLAILGFPANEFLGQEPGTNAEIKAFCTSNYGVEFDMFAKVVVKGEGQCPLYAYLTSAETNPQFAGEIQWNFTKFLVGRDGAVGARFEPRTKPDDPQVIKAIEAALAAG